MNIFDVTILGIVQGLTEFLPVSSSGHLVIARKVFGISDVQGTAFDAFLHLGTLTAVLVYYWRVWVGIGRGLFVSDTEGKDKRRLAAKLALATLPAAVVGYVFQGRVEVFRSITAVALGLILTALLLLVGDWLAGRVKVIKRANFQDAMYIGLFQVLALFPGVSRSGMTIAAGRWRGLSRKQAAHFSFLMSAPIIAGAGLSSLQSLVGGASFSMQHLLIAFLAAFIAGVVAIYTLLQLVERVSLKPFAIYLLLVAALLLVL